MMISTDLHQHLWTEPLLEALAARASFPYVRRERGLWILHAAGDMPCLVEPDTPDARLAALDADRVDRAVIALSSPIGIESLDPDVARELIDAHLQGIAGYGERFAAWGAIPTRGAGGDGPEAVDAMLARGCVGVSLPATALCGRAAVERVLPALERLEQHGAPLFVHPGIPAGEPALGEPLWWPALTDYSAQMQAAWLGFAALARRELPGLRVVFAMLAGGGLALAERLQARGGPRIDPRDPHTYYDTSSHGPRLVEAMARWAGPDRLVYGSDRPVIAPVLTGREPDLMSNATTLIDVPVAAR